MSDKMYKLCDIEEILAESEECFDEDCSLEIQLEDNAKIAIESPRVHIPDLNLTLRSGCFLLKDDDTGEFEPDFDVTIIYADTGEDCDDWLYYEQDGFVTALHNYLAASDPDKAGDYAHDGAYMCRILKTGE